MLLIAHRGLIYGPNSSIENSPTTIKDARFSGYDVEIDLWYIDHKWFLGHDNATYEIDIEWLKELDPLHVWIHTKNIDALYQLRLLSWPGHMFFHQNDDVVLTNTGYLWTFPGKSLTPLSICVMPEWIGPLDNVAKNSVHGFCTDYTEQMKSFLI